MKLIAKQKNTNSIVDWYELVFAHKHSLFFAATDSNKEMDIIVDKAISIDENIDFDAFKAWINERVNSIDSIPFHIVNGWKKEFKLLLEDYDEECGSEGGQTSDLIN